MSTINDTLYRRDAHVPQRVEAVMGQANQNDTLRAEALFRQALRDPSNLEMDWLWLAAQVARPSERCYCLQQALAINPRDEASWRGCSRSCNSPAPAIDKLTIPCERGTP